MFLAERKMMNSTDDVEKFHDVPLGQAPPEKAPDEGETTKAKDKVTGCRKYRYLVLGLLLLLIIGLAVGLAVGLTGGDDGHQDSPPPDEETLPPDEEVLVPPAPTDLEEKCSQENLLAGGATAAACEEACQPASCCVALGPAQCSDRNCAGYGICSQLYIQDANARFPYTKSFVDFACSEESTSDETGQELCTNACEPVGCCNLANDSCLQDEAESCVNYAKCHALEPTSPRAAPNTLADKCSPENIDDNPTPCEEACEPVKCCFSDELECPVSMFLACVDYVECQNLRPNKAIAVAPPGLGRICNPIWGDRDECESICEGAACCLGADPDVDSCLQSDFKACMSYTPCGLMLLSLPLPNNVVEPPPPNVAEVCSLSYLSGNGCDDCDAACTPADCCNDLNLGNCFLQDPIGCLQYGICGLRHLACGTVPWPAPGLAQTCSISNLELGGNNVQECLDACDPASCCLEDGEENCLEHNGLTCAAYMPCLTLYVAGGDLEPPDPGLDDLCLTDISACADACNEEASCCYSILEDNCLIGNIRTCADWLNSGCWRVPGWVF